MKQKRIKSPPKSLPIDVIHDEILTRLPAKSLLRCRCVSKLWCSIISTPSFMSTHFKKCQNNQEKSRLLVLEPPDMCDSKQICAIRSGEKFRKMSKIGLDVTWFEQYQAVSYVNGLLCMKKYVKETQLSEVFLWNPSIRKALELPFPTFSKDTKVRYDMDCALGYDHINNDYKVVASVYVGNELRIPKHIEVFTLSTFSWESASIGNGPCMWIKDGPKVFLNGIIYWGAIHVLKPTPKGRFSQFMSFDVTNDAFEYIDLPDNGHVHELEYERFPIILDQSVGLMKVFESYSQIWVMEDTTKGNKAQSWIKRFTINLQLLEKFIYFKLDGELLFEGEKGGVNSYNIKTQETKVLAKSYKLSPVFTSVYLESLALVEEVHERASYTFPPEKTIKSDCDLGSSFLYLFPKAISSFY